MNPKITYQQLEEELLMTPIIKSFAGTTKLIGLQKKTPTFNTRTGKDSISMGFV